MSYARITLNNEVLFDGELNQWVERTPDFVADLAENLKPGALKRPEPHMLAIMATFGEAMARQTDIIIEASTGPNWWMLNVKEN